MNHFLRKHKDYKVKRNKSIELFKIYDVKGKSQITYKQLVEILTIPCVYSNEKDLQTNIIYKTFNNLTTIEATDETTISLENFNVIYLYKYVERIVFI